MAGITLQHPNVNGGNAVVLNGASIRYSWKNLSSTNPIPGKYDITETEYSGFENPKIVITGHFDVDNLDSNELTQKFLIDFATLRSETPITLTVSTGLTSTTYLGGRPTDGYKTDGTNTLSNSINIAIDSFDIVIDSSADKGHLWSYTITCHETS